MSAKCLIVTSIFPPIHGGSAVVYENLARFGDGNVSVLAPFRHYQTHHVLVGWRDLDQNAAYHTHRLELIRPPQSVAKHKVHSAWLLLTTDLPLKAKVLWTVARIIRQEKIKVVCIGELNSGSWLGPWVRRLFGCKVVNYIHGEEITTTTTYRFFGTRRSHYLNAADAVVAVSGFTKNAITDLMNVPPENIRLIHNGVDLDRFEPRERSADLIERYGLAGKRVLLSVGRLVERKGIDQMIRAFARLVEQHHDLHYLVVGTGPDMEKLQAIAREEGVEDKVTFTGMVPDDRIADHYALAELFVLPNRELENGDTEGFGLVFLEANACGKPVIGGRAGGVVEAVRDGVNGLLVDGTNVDSIVETVNRVLTDPALYGTLKVGGLRVAQESSWQTRAEQFQAFCTDLVAGRSPAASDIPDVSAGGKVPSGNKAA